MKLLERLVLVQFFVCDAEELVFTGHTALLGPNGTGKTALLDAIQIVMLGAHERRIKFNAKKAGNADRRDIRDYCLGYFKPRDEGDAGNDGVRIVRRTRDSALTYITLVFRDDATGEAITAGVCLSASAQEPKARINGLYVAKGVDLRLADHTVRRGEDMWPLDWKEFEARLRRLAHKAGNVPVIEDRSEQYVKELLHVLQPQSASINPVEYQKAFRKSLLLNQIENVSDFVRDFVIDEEPIDRTRAMQLIHEFRRLQTMIAELQERIERLGVLQRQFAKIEREHRKLASVDALMATYQVEAAGDRAAELQDDLALAEKRLKQLQAEVSSLEPSLEAADKELERLNAAYLKDPAAQDLKDKQSLLEARAQSQHDRVLTLQRLVHQVQRALVAIGIVLPDAAGATLKQADKQLSAVSQQASTQGFDPVAAAVTDALTLLRMQSTGLSEQWRQAQVAHEQAKADYQALAGGLQNQRQGGVELRGGPARAVAALEQAGIKARPVCDLVKISDPQWQRSIETYLAGNRFALLVSAGREDEAVRLIRRPEQRIGGVKIIQPAHLQERLGRRPEAWSVATLVTGDNSQALAYVHGILGRLRRVSTEEELRLHPQSLTMDGLLSKSGGTETLNLLPIDDLVIGRRGDPAALAALQRELDDSGARVAALRDREKTLEAARDRLVQLGDFDETLAQVREAVKDADTAQHALATQQMLIDSISTAHLARLEYEISQAQARRDALRRSKDTAVEALGGVKSKVQATESGLIATWEALQRAQANEASKRQDPDFDAQLVDELRQSIDADGAGNERDYPTRMAVCQDELGKARHAAQRAITQALPDFGTFIDRFGYTLIEERSDWRKAIAWMEVTKQQITEAKLHEYEPQAALARDVAEQAFRKDVVFKLREGIRRMKQNIDTLNKILETCPPFSHNETYRFIYPQADEHKKLYDYIMWAGNDESSGTLFADDSDLSRQIMAMLHPQSTDGGKAGKNPLEDFRLMFNFDLQIRENGVPFSTLSKRIGSSSNGEHLTPFYVVAAAALTHAYRMDQSNGRQGAALMLLDEAFAAMDDQNAVATARFIDGLGLQMIMGAPSADSAKLSSFTDTLYELVREGDVMEFHREELFPAGHDLLRSDMPSEHPGLIATKLAQGPDASARA